MSKRRGDFLEGARRIEHETLFYNAPVTRMVLPLTEKRVEILRSGNSLEDAIFA